MPARRHTPSRIEAQTESDRQRRGTRTLSVVAAGDGGKVGGLLAGGNKVCAEIVIEFKVRATGKILRDEQLHLWTLNDRRQVVAFRHYLDTAKHIDASTP